MSIEIVNLPLDGIRTNGGTQPRVETNETAIAEYAEVIRFGGELPPVIVFDDGAELWLADGFHRFHAHRKAGAMEIACDVRQGTKRDAILFSVGANAAHGLRRSNEDKRKAVKTLLADAEWSAWSDNAIAKACGVSQPFVSSLRPVTSNVISEKQEEKTFTTKHGTQAVMKTANIGKTKPAQNTPPEAEGGMAAAPAEKTTPLAVKEAPSSVVEIPRDELAELRERIAELQASLKETVSDNEMMGRVFDAEDKLKAAMDEAKRQKAIADNAERTLAAKQGEFKARAEQVTYWKNRAEKAEKALSKVAA